MEFVCFYNMFPKYLHVFITSFPNVGGNVSMGHLSTSNFGGPSPIFHLSLCPWLLMRLKPVRQHLLSKVDPISFTGQSYCWFGQCKFLNLMCCPNFLTLRATQESNHEAAALNSKAKTKIC